MLLKPCKMKQQIIKYGEQYAAMFEVDRKKTNHAAKKLSGYMQIIKQHTNFYHAIIDELLKNENIGVLYWSCGIAWESGYRVDDVKIIMKSFINSSPFGVWRSIFSASYNVRNN